MQDEILDDGSSTGVQMLWTLWLKTVEGMFANISDTGCDEAWYDPDLMDVPDCFDPLMRWFHGIFEIMMVIMFIQSGLWIIAMIFASIHFAAMKYEQEAPERTFFAVEKANKHEDLAWARPSNHGNVDEKGGTKGDEAQTMLQIQKDTSDHHRHSKHSKKHLSGNSEKSCGKASHHLPASVFQVSILLLAVFVAIFAFTQAYPHPAENEAEALSDFESEMAEGLDNEVMDFEAFAAAGDDSTGSSKKKRKSKSKAAKRRKGQAKTEAPTE
ncbi:hypothetical protein Ocin01_19006 [Orchesella cincta]|uniref:Uncharacterized protein n=1 Tax=Orchesella cincta TaxID=48709 RepID=A0A1D2M401_ORCCI|nr:hypothetical protein Ocin01_19006 [Orchesella cincta]